MSGQFQPSLRLGLTPTEIRAIAQGLGVPQRTPIDKQFLDEIMVAWDNKYLTDVRSLVSERARLFNYATTQLAT